MYAGNEQLMPVWWGLYYYAITQIFQLSHGLPAVTLVSYLSCCISVALLLLWCRELLEAQPWSCSYIDSLIFFDPPQFNVKNLNTHWSWKFNDHNQIVLAKNSSNKKNSFPAWQAVSVLCKLCWPGTYQVQWHWKLKESLCFQLRVLNFTVGQ